VSCANACDGQGSVGWRLGNFVVAASAAPYQAGGRFQADIGRWEVGLDALAALSSAAGVPKAAVSISLLKRPPIPPPPPVHVPPLPPKEIVAEVVVEAPVVVAEVVPPPPPVEVVAAVVAPPPPPKPVVLKRDSMEDSELLQKWVDLLVGHPEIELVQVDVIGGRNKKQGVERVRRVCEFLVTAGVQEQRVKVGVAVPSKEESHIRILILRIAGD
jgi:hypothetical protein